MTEPQSLRDRIVSEMNLLAYVTPATAQKALDRIEEFEEAYQREAARADALEEALRNANERIEELQEFDGWMKTKAKEASRGD